MDGHGAKTRVKFAAPHAELRGYITTYYIAEVDSGDGSEISDLLHPEWASVRYVCSGSVRVSIFPEEGSEGNPVIVTGPTSRALPMACVAMKIASFGLLPLGWHQFVGLSAHDYADNAVIAQSIQSRVDFAALAPQVIAAENVDQVAAIFDAVFLAALNGVDSPERSPKDLAEEAKIKAVHRALLDSEIASVAQMTELLDISVMQLERLTKKIFGFPPKLLLRRQRFLRTLEIVLREPRSKWAEILDPQYFDQAHFNRDFRRFFGMSPTEYLAMPKPVVAASALERMRSMGDALQGLQSPQG